MATTLERRAGVLHRRRQLALTAITLDEMRAIWPLLDPDNLTDTVDPWLAASRTVVDDARERHVATASAYITVIDAAPTVTPPRLSPQALETSLRVTGPVRLERAIRVTGAAPPEWVRLALKETSRAAARHAANGARDLLLAHGDQVEYLRWRRLTSSGACDFCKMLAGRGAVYHSRETGGFQAHDGCACYPTFEKVTSRL
jgi:hypothetical protein